MTQTANVSGIPSARGVGTVSGALITDSTFFSLIYDTDVNSVFLNLSEFGETCRVYHSGSRAWATYNTLFDDPHFGGNLMSDAEFNTFRPQIQLNESALLQPINKRDRIYIRGVEYIVDDVIGDGVGIVTIYLRVK